MSDLDPSVSMTEAQLRRQRLIYDAWRTFHIEEAHSIADLRFDYHPSEALPGHPDQMRGEAWLQHRMTRRTRQ